MGESTYLTPYIGTSVFCIRVLIVKSLGRSDGVARVSKSEASDLLVVSWVSGSISTPPSIQILIGKAN